MKQNLGARLKYSEQYCMSNIITSCLLGSKYCMHACMHTILASQRVKGYYKNAAAKHDTSLSLELKKAQLSEEGGGGDQRQATVPKAHV